MKPYIKTFRLLKKDHPDKARVEKLFAKKDDQILLGAIANPDHSATAVEILRALAVQRGVQDDVEEDWAQTEESMFVAPFGKRPTFEKALAAPGRRRRVYRSLQVIMIACVIAGFITLSYFKPYDEWVESLGSESSARVN